MARTWFPARLLELTAALLLGGCAALPARPPPALPLLAPSALGAERQAQQIVRVAIGERELALRGVVQADAQQLLLIGVDGLGRRVLTLRWDGRELGADPAPPGLDPRRLLADLQLVLWPLAAWQTALAGSAWELSEPAPGARRLRHAGRLVAEVHFAPPGGDPWQGRAWLVNFVHDYTVDLESTRL